MSQAGKDLPPDTGTPSFTYGIASPEDIAAMTGREMMQALIDGRIPAPPITQTLSY
jgi:hypothetical protein